MILYSVKDIKSGKFGQPFAMPNDEAAIRSFLLSLANVMQPTILTAYPSDFELYRVGEFNEESGAITPLSGGSVFVSSSGSHYDQFVSLQRKYIELRDDKIENKFISELSSKISRLETEFSGSLMDPSTNTAPELLSDLLIKLGLKIKQEDNINE